MTTHQPHRVTFVGIGAIGLPMARQVHEAGFEVIGVDPFGGQRKKAVAAGLRAEAEPASAAEADAVIVMVATPDQLLAVALGAEGLISRMKPGATLIVMSTVGPEPVKEVAQAAEESDVLVLDVPVTGGVAQAVTAGLTLFASGAEDLIAAQRPLLEAMGRVVECGEDPGMGQSYKVVNQLLCSVHLAAAGEALALAEKLGLDPAKILPAVESGAAGSWMLSDRGPRMLEGLDADVASAISIFVKDSSMVSDIAEEVGFHAPLVRSAREKFLEAREMGLEHRDDSQVIQAYRN